MATIVCDVNETLLDLSGLDQPFAAAFADRGPEIKRLWFAKLLHMSAVLTTIGTWQDFGVVGRVVLGDVSRAVGLAIDGEAAEEIVASMRQLPAHDDVVPALSALRDAGHAVVALTNSSQATAEAQLSAAGIDHLMDRIMSVDATMRFKPDPAVYLRATSELDQQPTQLVMLAAHDWDCAGAMRVGWRSAFVGRGGQRPSVVLQQPTWQGPDLQTLASTLIDAL